MDGVERSTDLLFDARHIEQSGIGTYIRVQIPRLEDVLTRHGLTLTVLADSDTVLDVGANTEVVTAQPPAAGMYSLDEQRAWDRAVRSTRPRAVWTPHYPFPMTLWRRSNRRILYFATVHDDNHLLPQDISGQGAAKRLYARLMLEFDARRSVTIFSPSQAAADALAKIAPSARYVVTPIPVDEKWLRPVDPQLSPVAGGYVLYLGNVKRHKNLPTLLAAYADVHADIPQNLVIAGSGASVRMLDERVHTQAAALGERVQMIGRLEFDQLHALVAGADLLVMPSLNEGAGLPPVEAMASHTPVVCSSIPSLRETCGDGADYFDPHDERQLAILLRSLCLDSAARAELAARGWAHVTRRQAQLDTDAAANTIVAALERCPR